MNPSLPRALALVTATLWAAGMAAAQTTITPPGRLLASNCFQCHGTNGKGPGFEPVAGKSATDLFNKLKEFQTGHEGDGIMTRHAMGYSDVQLRALAQWLSTQR